VQECNILRIYVSYCSITNCPRQVLLFSAGYHSCGYGRVYLRAVNPHYAHIICSVNADNFYTVPLY